MELKLMKEALKHYALSADCSAADRDKVLEMVGECQATIDRMKADDWITKDGCLVQVIPSIVLTDFLNLTTYDDYGKLARQHGGECRFEYYMRKVQDIGLGFSMLTADQVMCGYDYLSDLWHDNEESGEHNPDGTLKRISDNQAIDKDLLQRVIKRLQDKVTIDQEYMEKDDLRQLLNDIDELKQAVQKQYMDKVCGITTITLD
jgi:hypothetical protein